MNKEYYDKLDLEIIVFGAEDVITASPNQDGEDGQNGEIGG